MGIESRPSVTFQIRGRSFKVERPRLKLWLQLDEVYQLILKNKINRKYLADCIIRYVSIATGESVEFLYHAPWYEIIDAFGKIVSISLPKIHLPMMEMSERFSENVAWDYAGRAWYSWANIFSKAYKWSLEYIANLEIEDALALIQEILVDEQLQREWEWSLSENAYGFNQATKQAEFIPLPRPSWMRPKIQPITKVKIRKDMIPVGNVIDLSNLTDRGIIQ